MVLPGLVSRIVVDAAFRAQFLADPAAAIAAQEITLEDEEWAALLSVQQFLMRPECHLPIHKVSQSDKWIGGIPFTQAGLPGAL